MEDRNLRSRFVKGVIWKLLSQFSTKGVTFIVGIVLARLLGPEAFGIVAMITIFVSMSEVLVNCGFGMPLVQKKSISQTDLNSVFYLQISLACLFYCVLFVSSPLIAKFYNTPVLTDVLRVQALVLPLNAVLGLQQAVLARELRFNVSFIVNVSASLTSAAVGISLAFLGLGYWALVCSSLTSSFVSMTVSYIYVRWFPTKTFSLKSLRDMFQMGWKIMVAGFADTFFSELTGMVIGKFYTSKDLAFYNRGRQLPSTAMDVINSSLSSVAFPALSKLQSDPDRLREAMRKIIRVSSFFVMPLLAGLSAASEPIVYIMFGEEWMPAAPFVAIACISFAFYPFATANLQAIKAIGRTDYYLKLSIAKDIVGFVILLCFFRLGVIYIALAYALIATPIGMIINAYPNKKLLNYGFISQISDVLPVMLMSIFMAIVVWTITFIPIDSYLVKFALQVPTGLLVYYILLHIVKPKAFALACEGFPFFKKLVFYKI